MKKFALAAVIAALSATSAQSADMAARTYTKAPMMATVFSWTGWYAGVNAGGVWGTSNVNATYDPTVFGLPAVFAAATNNKLSGSGFTGGAQVGYNYQFGPNWVAGLEGDFNFTDLSVRRSTIPVGIANRVDQSFDSNWLSTIRGRVGYSMDKVLFYGTGGAAIARVKTTEITGPDTSFSVASKVKTGWTAGAGVEWAFAPSWSVKAEYLYVDLGNIRSGPFVGAAAPNPATNISHKVTEDIARAGINYHF